MYYHALIRTHHITSRKKVARLKAAAKSCGCLTVLRSGGTPGIMYVAGRDEEAVREWVEVVHSLRYKDYHLAADPAPISDESTPSGNGSAGVKSSGKSIEFGWSFEEVDTVKDFGKVMEDRGVLAWWRHAMDFTG